MVNKRYEISDLSWLKIFDFPPGKSSAPGRTAKDNRSFVNGFLWALRTGAPWEDLPERYGKYKSVHKRYSRWCEKGVWNRAFKALATDKDNEYLMIDSTIVKPHSQSATYKKKTKAWEDLQEN